MTESLEKAIVRICTPNKKYVGVGVFISDKHVLTCGHVVADSLRLLRTTQDQPAEPIFLDFPFVSPGTFLSSKVVFWRSVLQDQSILPEMGEDIACLELYDLPPSSASPIPLCQSVQASELAGHQFEVFGIPAGNPQGSWADGIVSKRLANGWIQIGDKEQGGFQIEPGFSGSPVWDKQLKAVIGITVAADPNRPQAKVGFMIPTWILFSTWKDSSWTKYVEYWETHEKFDSLAESPHVEDSEIKTSSNILVEDDLKSKKGIDYNLLRDLLSSGDYVNADKETLQVICQAADIDQQDEKRFFQLLFPEKKLRKISCDDIRIIDNLWLKYSNGKFGFSAQKENWNNNQWRNYHGNAHDYFWVDICIQNGWGELKGRDWALFKYQDLIFDTSAPTGQLPCLWMFGEHLYDPRHHGWNATNLLRCVFDRMKACEIK